MDLMAILKEATEKSASDIFIVGGAPLSYKAHGVISRFSEEILTTAQTEVLVKKIFAPKSKIIYIFVTLSRKFLR